MKLGELKVNGTGSPGGETLKPCFSGLLVCMQSHFTCNVEGCLRAFWNPLVIYLDITHNHKPSLIIKWLPVGREIML